MTTGTPGERALEFVRGHSKFHCELRDHGGFGVDAQFFCDDEFLLSQRFRTRVLALQWAENQRSVVEQGVA